ncbi:MAG: hypothetical protein P8Y36_06355 [Alphaproteobacteria bacterium]|jgi:hypothetical protein
MRKKTYVIVILLQRYGKLLAVSLEANEGEDELFPRQVYESSEHQRNNRNADIDIKDGPPAKDANQCKD